MALLLDTQIIIWMEQAPELIPEDVKEKILNQPLLYISKASIWEMAIKIKTGKLLMHEPL